jgi:hypothetical protein
LVILKTKVMTNEQFIYWLKGFIDYQQLQEIKNPAFNVIKDELNKVSDLSSTTITTSHRPSPHTNAKPYTIPCGTGGIGVPNGIATLTTTEGRTDITYKTDGPITYTTN